MVECLYLDVESPIFSNRVTIFSLYSLFFLFETREMEILETAIGWLLPKTATLAIQPEAITEPISTSYWLQFEQLVRAMGSLDILGIWKSFR